MPRATAEDKVKLNVQHIFNCSMETYWSMFWDPAYGEMLERETGMQREVLWMREEGPLKVYRVKFIPNADLPAPIAKIAGTKKLIYEQENRLNTETNVMQWQVFPAVVKDKVSAKGTMAMTTVSNGVQRIVDGEVTVRVPLVGKKIEKAIMASVISSYEQAAQITQKWLDEQNY